MRIDFYGLGLDTPFVTFHLWSPWRAAELEHRLFNAVLQATKATPERGPDEARLQISDARSWKAAIQAVARVLKGWQEEGDPSSERRSWRWLVEGDTDADGYDHNGEPNGLWGLLSVSLERGGLGESEKGEEIDLEGFGLRIYGEGTGRLPRG